MTQKQRKKVQDTFSTYTAVRAVVPRLPYQKIKERVLGSTYTLSLAFISPTESKRLNASLRGKQKAANVLAFPLSKRSGEILICLAVARRDAEIFNTTYRGCVAMLFIHGLLHLKGYSHGSTMDREERRVRRFFSPGG